VPEKYVKNTETTRGILSSLSSARKVKLGEIHLKENHDARCSSVMSLYALSRARARAYRTSEVLKQSRSRESPRVVCTLPPPVAR